MEPDYEHAKLASDALLKRAREIGCVIEPHNWTRSTCFGMVSGFDDQAWLIKIGTKIAIVLPFCKIQEGGVIPRFGDNVWIETRNGFVKVDVRICPKNARLDAAKAGGVETKNAGLRPAPVIIPSAKIVPPSAPSDDSDSFGLLNLKPAAKKAASKAPAFFSQDDSTPVIPDLQFSKTGSENTNSGLRPAPPFSPPESKSENKKPPASLRCLSLQDGPLPLKKRENIPPEIYLPGDLEHPKIPGLMLSLDDRLYGAALEYANKDGEIKLETPDEKRFRVLWKHPIAMTPTMTGDSFTKMDMSLFKKH